MPFEACRLFVQIADWQAFSALGTKILARDDLARETVDLGTLGRGPFAEAFDPVQKPEPKNLRILADSGQGDRSLARRDRVAGAQLQNLARAVLELGCAANDAMDDALALGEIGHTRRRRRALGQKRLAPRVGRDDVAGHEM